MASLKYTVDVDTRGARSSISSLEKSLGGIGKAVVGGFALGNIVAFGDSIIGLQNKLRSLTSDSTLVTSMFKDITTIAGNARAPLKETGDLYFRIARAAGDLGITQQQTASITDSLAKSMAMTGMTATESAGALLQLGQALQSGRFAGDELRSVLENMPVVSRAMADELGVTIGQLRQLGSEGKITADVFVRAMQKNKKSIDDAFARSVPTALQALTNLKTAFAIAFDEMAKEEGPVKILADMAAGFLNLSKDIPALVSAIKRLIIVLGVLAFAFLTLGKNALVIRGITSALNGLEIALRSVARGTTFALMARDLKGVKNAMTGLKGAFGPFSEATGKIMTSAKSAGAAGKAFARLGQGVFSVTAILGSLLKFGVRFLGWVGVFIAIAQAVDFLWVSIMGGAGPIDWFMKKLGAMIDATKQFFGFKPTAAPAGTPRPTPRPDNSVFGNGKPKPTPDSQQQINAFKQIKKSIDDITRSYKEQITYRLEDLALELRLLGLSSDQAELEQAKHDVIRNQVEAITDLNNKEQEIRDNTELSNKGRANALALINSQRIAVNAAAKEELDSTAKLIEQKQELILKNEQLTHAMELQQLALDNKKALTDLAEQLSLVGLYGDALEDATTKLAVEEDLQNKLLDIDKKRLEIEKDRTKLGEARFTQEMANLDALTVEANKAAKDQAIAKKKITDAERKSERFDVGNAIDKRMFELARSVDPAIVAVEGLNSVFSNMGTAIDNFVDTGKFKFSDFARSIIADLAKIALKAAATKILTSIVGSLFGAPSFGGLAAGGSVFAGKPKLVGEQGPELFVPNSAGSIMTNASMNKNMGMQQNATPVVNNTYITNNISAIDSRSVAQMFVANRKSLFGAHSMARKELPYS